MRDTSGWRTTSAAVNVVTATPSTPVRSDRASASPDGSPRGYIVHWVDDRPVGFMVRAASSTLRPGIGAMCSFCHTPQPSTQVLMFSAPKGGAAGRDGNTIGTYLCADLACSMMIRMLPATSELTLSRSEVVARRSAGLTERLQRFTANLLKTA